MTSVPQFHVELIDEATNELFALGENTSLFGAADPFPYLTLEVREYGVPVLRLTGIKLDIAHPGLDALAEMVEAANRYQDLCR